MGESAVKTLREMLVLLSCLLFAGCQMPVEICYEHPTYGRVCLTLYGKTVVDGKKADGTPLSDKEKADVQKKLAGETP